MARKFKGGWLPAYREYIVKQESPDNFHFWVGCQIISAALRRRVFIDRGAYRIYPNQYVFLIATSGACRKSAAMEIGLDLLSDLSEISIVHERTTVEGLMDLMGSKAVVMPDNKVVPDGSVFIHADELSNLFGKASYITDLVSFMTAAYTAKAKLDFLTRNKGMRRVRNACPTVLAGTTPEQMGEIFPSATLSSGFMGRVILVIGERSKRVAKPILNHMMRSDLINDIKEISKLAGEVKVTEEADKAFDKWYESTHIAGGEGPLSAFYERKHDHLLKLAMILSISESSRMILELKHLQNALYMINAIEAGIPRAISYIGATQQSNVADIIFAIVQRSYPDRVSHSHLLRRVYKYLNNAQEFSGIIDLLIDQNRITTETDARSRFYVLAKEEIDKIRSKNK